MGRLHRQGRAGKSPRRIGFIKPDGELDPSAHSFTNRLVNTKGEFNDLHQIWHNRVLAYNNTFNPAARS